MFLSVFKGYKKLSSDVVKMLLAFFCLQLINAAFYFLLNYYLAAKGFKDFEIAGFISYRYLAIMLAAIPLGFIIKGRKLKPYFLASAILCPLASFALVWSAENDLSNLVIFSLFTWGAAFVSMQAVMVPFILRNAKEETHSEAIALTFATWSMAVFICGVLNIVLENISPNLFNERNLVLLFTALGSVSFLFVLSIKEDNPGEQSKSTHTDWKHYDWWLITKALIPRLIVATGAGLTIPFINLFFLYVFKVDFKAFSLMGIVMALLVTYAHFSVPALKKKYGYSVAITLVQAISVLVLIALALTQYIADYTWAVYLAAFLYIIRQPLMNMAGPMTSELSVYYVGKKNSEMVSALGLSIWSGSWFFSSQIFKFLRSSNVDYAQIFLITAALYGLGVGGYFMLIKDYNKRAFATESA